MKSAGRVLVSGLFFITSVALGQVWVQQITGARVIVYSIATDREGNCFVSGSSFGNSNELVNFGATNLTLGPFFARYSRKGNFLFAHRTDEVRTLASVGSKLMATDGTDVFEVRDNGRVISKIKLKSPERSVTQISSCDDGTFVAAGVFRDSLTIGKKSLQASDTDEHSAFITRLTTDGKPIWLAKAPSGFIYDIAGTRKGGAFALGYFTVSAFGSKGELLWTNGIPGSYNGSPYSIAADPLGNWTRKSNISLQGGRYFRSAVWPAGYT